MATRTSPLRPGTSHGSRNAKRSPTQDGPSPRLSQTLPKQSHRSRPDTAESYAVEYFRTNPLDKREPREKLAEVEERLSEDIDENDRFHLLIQQKSLCYLAFGETSAESVEAMRQLGHFYNEQRRPECALRHLAQAQELAQGVDLTDVERLTLAVAYADALLSVTPATRQEEHKNLSAADMALNPLSNFDPDDQLLAYRRDLVSARLKGRKGRLTESMIQYERAAKTLDILNKGDTTEMTAQLYQEMARTAENGNDGATALRLYRRAYSIFRELGFTDEADVLEQKIQVDLETDSDEAPPVPEPRRTPPRRQGLPLRAPPPDVQDDSSSVFEVHDDDEEDFNDK
jgi:tetratricopeptide (TPR) repeat protein